MAAEDRLRIIIETLGAEEAGGRLEILSKQLESFKQGTEALGQKFGVSAASVSGAVSQIVREQEANVRSSLDAAAAQDKQRLATTKVAGALATKGEVLNRVTGGLKTMFATVLGHPYFAFSSALATTRGSLLAVGVGAAALGTALVFLFNRISSHILFLRNMSFELGVTTQQMARFAAVGAVTGVPLTQLGQGFRNLNNALQGVGPAGIEARRQLEALGVVKPGEIIPTAQAFERLVAIFKDSPEDIDKFNRLTAIAGDRFSVTFQALVRGAGDASPEIQRLRQEFQEFLSPENIQRSIEFQARFELFGLRVKTSAMEAGAALAGLAQDYADFIDRVQRTQTPLQRAEAVKTPTEAMDLAVAAGLGRLQVREQATARLAAAPALEAQGLARALALRKDTAAVEEVILRLRVLGLNPLERQARDNEAILGLVQKQKAAVDSLTQASAPLPLEGSIQAVGRDLQVVVHGTEKFLRDVNTGSEVSIRGLARQAEGQRRFLVAEQEALALLQNKTSVENEILRLQAQINRAQGNITEALRLEEQIEKNSLALRFRQLEVQGKVDKQLRESLQRQLEDETRKALALKATAELERQSTDELLNRQRLRADELRAAQQLSDFQLQASARLARERLELARMQARRLGVRAEGIGTTREAQAVRMQEILLEGKARELAAEEEIARTKLQSLEVEAIQRKALNDLSVLQAQLEIATDREQRDRLQREIQAALQLLVANEKLLALNEALIPILEQQSKALGPLMAEQLKTASREGALRLQRDLTESFARIFDDMLIRGRAAFSSLKNFAQSIMQAIFRTIFQRIGESIASQLVGALEKVANRGGILGSIFGDLLGRGPDANTIATDVNSQATVANTIALNANTTALTAAMAGAGIAPQIPGAPGLGGTLLQNIPRGGSLAPQIPGLGGGGLPAGLAAIPGLGPLAAILGVVGAGAAGGGLGGMPGAALLGGGAALGASGILSGGFAAAAGLGLTAAIGALTFGIGAAIGLAVFAITSLLGRAERREEERRREVEEAMKRQAFEFLPQRQFRFLDANSIEQIFANKPPGFTTGMSPSDLRLAGGEPSVAWAPTIYVSARTADDAREIAQVVEKTIKRVMPHELAKSGPLTSRIREITFPA